MSTGLSLRFTSALSLLSQSSELDILRAPTKVERKRRSLYIN